MEACLIGDFVVEAGCSEVVEVLGVVAPLLDDGLLHPPGIALGVNANLLGDLHTVGLGNQPVKKMKQWVIFPVVESYPLSSSTSALLSLSVFVGIVVIVFIGFIIGVVVALASASFVMMKSGNPVVRKRGSGFSCGRRKKGKERE